MQLCTRVTVRQSARLTRSSGSLATGHALKMVTACPSYLLHVLLTISLSMVHGSAATGISPS